MRSSRAIWLPLLFALPMSVLQAANSCFSHFMDTPAGTTTQCAEAAFSGAGFFESGESNGPLSASLDGVSIFPAPPDFIDPITEPFFGSVAVTGFSAAPAVASEFSIGHRGRVGMFPYSVDPAPNNPNRFIGESTQSKVVFIATSTSKAPSVPVQIELDQTVTFMDPLDNLGSGRLDASFRLTLQVLGTPTLVVDLDGLMFFDSGVSPAPTPLDDYVGFVSFDNDPGSSTVTFSRLVTVNLITDTPFELGSIQALGVSTNIFNLADESAWSVDGLDTFEIRVSSSDPEARFSVIAPVPVPAAWWLLGPGVLALIGLGTKKRPPFPGQGPVPRQSAVHSPKSRE